MTFKVGDLVRYKYDGTMGVIFYINPEEEFIKMLTTDGLEKWCVASNCEAIA